MYMYIHVREMNKEGRSKQGQTNSKAKQHSTPKVVTFPKKMSCFQRNSNPRHSTLCIDRVLYTAIYMYCIDRVLNTAIYMYCIDRVLNTAIYMYCIDRVLNTAIYMYCIDRVLNTAIYMYCIDRVLNTAIYMYCYMYIHVPRHLSWLGPNTCTCTCACVYSVCLCGCVQESTSCG